MESLRICLSCTEGGADKVYHVQLKESADGAGWLVTAQSGPRNGSLKAQDKISSPVSYAAALAAYTKLVKSKTAKGYCPMDGAVGNTLTLVSNKTDTGVRPQLLNPIDDVELERYLCDNRWYMQEKFDGERVLIQHEAGRAPIGINRTGFERPLPVGISEAIATLTLSCIIDGELVGERFYAFDLLECGDDIRANSYRSRQQNLRVLLSALPEDAAVHFPTVPTHTHEIGKREALARLRAANAEGVAFHLADSAYTAGRPSSGGDAAKFKFYETATCVVSRVNEGKRSVALYMLDNERATLVDVGNVTIPANHPIPVAGQPVEIRYLYAFPAGGSLFQPVYLGARSDIPVADCLYSQLKFKASALAA